MIGSCRGHAERAGRLWRVVTPAAGVLALLLFGVAVAGAQDLGYTVSLFGARTSLPGATFDSVSLFNSVDAEVGRVRVWFGVPFVRQHTATEAWTDPATGVVTPAADFTATGFGDPLVRADVRVVDDRARALSVSVAGSVKLPLVDSADGLGTGETDLAVGVSVYKAHGRTALLVDALYWTFGDPEGVDFVNGLSYSAGVARTMGQAGRWSTMVSLSGFTGGYDDLAPPTQLNVGVLSLVGRRQSVSVSAGVGLTESAPDFMIGTSWRIAR